MSLVKEFHRCPPEQLHPVNEDLMRQVGNFKMNKIVCIINIMMFLCYNCLQYCLRIYSLV